MDSQVSTPVTGKIKLTVIKAMDLIDKHFFGKNAPYLMVYLDNQESDKAQKQNFEKNADGKNPVFDHEFDFDLRGEERAIHVEVWGKEILRDSKLGWAIIPVSDLIQHKNGQSFQFPLTGKDEKAEAGFLQLSINFDASFVPMFSSVDALKNVAAPVPVDQTIIKDASSDVINVSASEWNQDNKDNKLMVKDNLGSAFKDSGFSTEARSNDSTISNAGSDVAPSNIKVDSSLGSNLNKRDLVTDVRKDDTSSLGQGIRDIRLNDSDVTLTQDKNKDVIGKEKHHHHHHKHRTEEEDMMSSQKKSDTQFVSEKLK